jgi:hypothetical protein
MLAVILSGVPLVHSGGELFAFHMPGAEEKGCLALPHVPPRRKATGGSLS